MTKFSVKYIFAPAILFFTCFGFAQIKPNNSGKTKSLREISAENANKKKASFDMYQIISLDRDTTYIDTSLTIKKEYSHNFLRKDNFGLLAFPNEGQAPNTLFYGNKSFSAFPQMGFTAKHFSFLEAQNIRYANVATPVTELFLKTVAEQGQMVDSYIAVNTSPRLNFSVAYKGLRSLGKYINQLASAGNFRATISYKTKDQRYIANAHFVSQDILNGENGGIVNNIDFESANPDYSNRARIQVFNTNAKSKLVEERLFLDHTFRIDPKNNANNLLLSHQFLYSSKDFNFNQATLETDINGKNYYRYGTASVASNLNDDTKYNQLYNKLSLAFENKTVGQFSFFIDDFRSNYYYNKIIFKEDGSIIGNRINQQLNNFGGQYDYRKNNWTGKLLISKSFGNLASSNLSAQLNYNPTDDFNFVFGYQNISKIPNNNFNLYQSSYVAYNWDNNFKNEKINILSAQAQTPWLEANLQLMTLGNHLYFADVATADQKSQFLQLVKPFQLDNTINYMSLQLKREFKFGRFALDNTFLYQKSDKQSTVFNVPDIVTRHSFYYSDTMFKKAMFYQTGIVFNYFSKFYGNDYNPVLGEFFVQNEKQIGGYPMFDFFFNARIQRTRIYLKAEHFNAKFTGSSYFSAPNTPYRDFLIRFGLVWNFFN